MEEERKKLRVIHVFDNGEDAAIEMAGRSDKTITPPGISCAMGEQQVLMNVAFNVYFYLFKYEAGEISKTELDLYLRTSLCSRCQSSRNQSQSVPEHVSNA